MPEPACPHCHQPMKCAFTIATAEEFPEMLVLYCAPGKHGDIAAPKHSISLALVVNEPKSLHSVQSNDRLGRVVDGHISSLEL